MATARVSKPRAWYLLKVSMMRGISATQVVQLVAQKFTRVTLPLKSVVVFLLPSKRTKVVSGASVALADEKNTHPMAEMARNAARYSVRFISGVFS